VHVDEILFSNTGFKSKSKVIGDFVSIAFSDDLTGVLHGELYFQVLVPVGTGFEFSFPDPFGIILVNVLYLKIMVDVELFQSGPD